MFLLRKASDDRSPYGDFWFEPVSTRTLSGARVSAETAMRLSAVYACVRVLAESFSVLPFVLYRNKPNGGKQRITDHWLYRLFSVRPNDYQNAFEWREMMQGHLSLRGNAYNHIVQNSRGEITELRPLHPDRVTPFPLTSGSYAYQVRNDDGSHEVLTRAEIWHLRGLSSNGIVGLNPIEMARETIGLGLSAQAYGARFFDNDAKPGGWIEYPGTFKDKDARTTFRDSFQAAQSGFNRGKAAVLEHGMKYHELTLSNEDAQFLETRKFQVSEIARIFRVPPHMIGDLERSTNNNIEQQAREFVMHTMTPWAERWEAAIEAELLLDDEGLEVEFDFANLLRGDSKARAEYYSSGIQTGWLTRNEARTSENLDPLDGLDEPLMPLNMVEQDDAPDPDAATDPEDTQSQPPNDTEARLLALATRGAMRLARKEQLAREKSAARGEDRDTAAVAFYAKHADYVAESLAISIETATAYCNKMVGLTASGVVDLYAVSLAELTQIGMASSSRPAEGQQQMMVPRIEIHAPITVNTPATHVQVPEREVHITLPEPKKLARVGEMERGADGKMRFTMSEQD